VLNIAITNARFLDRWDVADSLIRVGRDRGFRDAAALWSRAQAVGRGEWERADALCDSLLAAAASLEERVPHEGYCGALDIMRGRIRRGVERTSTAAQAHYRAGQPLNFFRQASTSGLGEVIAGRREAARSHFESIISAIPSGSVQEPDRYVLRATLRAVVGAAGFPDLADRVAAVYPMPALPDTAHWSLIYGETMSEAALALNEGEAGRAVELLRQVRALSVGPWAWEFWVHLMTGLAFERLAEPDSAVTYLEAAIRPAGVDFGFTRVHVPVVERRLAELEASRGNTEAAIRHYQRFLELWSDADPELQNQVESAREALALLIGDETR
jgi:tetratricopeptide (TPR) repeat protein